MWLIVVLSSPFFLLSYLCYCCLMISSFFFSSSNVVFSLQVTSSVVLWEVQRYLCFFNFSFSIFPTFFFSPLYIGSAEDRIVSKFGLGRV